MHIIVTTDCIYTHWHIYGSLDKEWNVILYVIVSIYNYYFKWPNKTWLFYVLNQWHLTKGTIKVGRLFSVRKRFP
jgi:hypothetical protein